MMVQPHNYTDECREWHYSYVAACMYTGLCDAADLIVLVTNCLAIINPK